MSRPGPIPRADTLPNRAGCPLFLAGPTAAGKSTVALEIAKRLGGEILTVDSMQVYRGLDVGTAKPSPAEQAEIPHHLIDLVDPGEPFDAAQWLELARACHDAVRERGRLPIFCGGTGLYFRAWFEGLDQRPAPDPDLRRELEARLLPDLLAELAERDPATLARLDRRNPRRVVRALEIVRLTGRPLPGPRDPASSDDRVPVVVLRRHPPDLRRRIEERVDAMFARGLVAETQALLARGLGTNRTALQAIGYRQAWEHLQGVRDLPATVALVKTKTWQFARRQMTWFRHQPGVRWLDVPSDEPPGRTADRLLASGARERPDD